MDRSMDNLLYGGWVKAFDRHHQRPSLGGFLSRAKPSTRTGCALTPQIAANSKRAESAEAQLEVSPAALCASLELGSVLESR